MAHRNLKRWLLLLIPCPARAQTWSESGHVVDGNIIYVDRTRLRLLSMGAFESSQTC